MSYFSPALSSSERLDSQLKSSPPLPSRWSEVWSRAGALTVRGFRAAPGRRSRVPRRGVPCSHAMASVEQSLTGVCLQPDLPSETQSSPPRTTPGHVAIVPPFYKTGNVLSRSGKRLGHTTSLGREKPI